MDFTNLKNCMDELVSDFKVPGLDCVVYKDHEMVYRYFAGMRDIENNVKMSGEELYIIFSMTKMLTCTGALQLFEKGKFLMSDPLYKYLPEFEKMKISDSELDTASAAKITTGASAGEIVDSKQSGFAKRYITIQDLFTMSAGLDYDLCDDAIKDALAQGKKTTRELVSAMANKVLGFEPGTRFRYSLCHDVLGALIEVISGQKFGDYMREHVFEPIGMKNTFFGIPKDEESLSRMMVRYNYGKDLMPVRMPMECIYILSDEYESGGAGLVSCADDYALFLDTLACGGKAKNGNRILSPATVKLMGTNHMTGKRCEDFSELRDGYGYGLGVRTHIDKVKSGSLSPLGEFGWDGAAGAFSLVDPENKLSFVYFQEIHGWDLRIQTKMRNALYSCLD